MCTGTRPAHGRISTALSAEAFPHDSTDPPPTDPGRMCNTAPTGPNSISGPDDTTPTPRTRRCPAPVLPRHSADPRPRTTTPGEKGSIPVPPVSRVFSAGFGEGAGGGWRRVQACGSSEAAFSAATPPSQASEGLGARSKSWARSTAMRPKVGSQRPHS